MCVCVCTYDTFKVMVYEKSQFKAENEKNVNCQVLDFAHTIPVVILLTLVAMVNCFTYKFTYKTFGQCLQPVCSRFSTIHPFFQYFACKIRILQ